MFPYVQAVAAVYTVIQEPLQWVNKRCVKLPEAADKPFKEERAAELKWVYWIKHSLEKLLNCLIVYLPL